jgi:hypothetical protein
MFVYLGRSRATRRVPSRRGDQHGQPWTVIPNPENGNVELRPLAEQIIDALLTEDDSRYAVYSAIRARRNPGFFDVDSGDEDIDRQVGLFMRRWIEFEVLIRQLSARRGIRGPVALHAAMIADMFSLDHEMLVEYDRLRRMRNEVVHGIEIPAAADLAEAAHRLEVITAEINRRNNDSNPAA